MTSNAPGSLDPALTRPGRIDREVELEFSSQLVASITFSRIFGTDPRLKGKLRKQDVDWMANAFGEKIPHKKFTPCEIQQYCMARRGKPEKAIRELERWIRRKDSGVKRYKYDINDDAMGTGAHEQSPTDCEEEPETWEALTQNETDTIARGTSSRLSEHDRHPIEDGLPETEYQLSSDQMLVRKNSGFPGSESGGSLWNWLKSVISSWIEDFHQFNDLSSEFYTNLPHLDPEDLSMEDYETVSGVDSSATLDITDPMPISEISEILVSQHSDDEDSESDDEASGSNDDFFSSDEMEVSSTNVDNQDLD